MDKKEIEKCMKEINDDIKYKEGKIRELKIYQEALTKLYESIS